MIIVLKFVFKFFNRHGSDERVFRLEFVSNQDFTDTEFFRWKDAVAAHGIQLPTREDIEKKIKDIESASNYEYKEDDIEVVGMTCCHYFNDRVLS